MPCGFKDDLWWLGVDEGSELRDRFEGDALKIVVDYLRRLIISDADVIAKKAKRYWVENGRLWERHVGLGHAMEVVPRSEGKQIAENVHEDSGHMGADLLRRQIQRSTTWPRIRLDCQEACNNCESCADFGPKTQGALLNHIHRYTPLDMISMDYMFLPTQSDGAKCVCVAVDVMTRFIWAWPFSTYPSSQTTIEAMEDLRLKYKLPKACLTDNGSHFTSNAVRDRYKSVEWITSSPYAHVGVVEAANKLVLDRLRRLMNVDLRDAVLDSTEKDNWKPHLLAAVASLNDRKLPQFGEYSPRELLFGVLDKKSVPGQLGINAQDVSDRRLEASLNMEDSQLQSEDAARDLTFRKGQLVQMYQHKWENTRHTGRKLMPKWKGSFRITEVRRSSARLEVPGGCAVRGWIGFWDLRVFAGKMVEREKETGAVGKKGDGLSGVVSGESVEGAAVCREGRVDPRVT